MALVGYARVSSTDQSVDLQREQLEAAGCERVFAETGSGKSVEGRDALQDALQWVREGDTLVVTRLDRLARSIADLHGIADQLKAKGVGLRALQQGGQFDTTTAAGELLFGILGLFAQFELAIRRERQLEGIAKAKVAGVYRGRKPSVPKDEVRRLKAEGLNNSQIAKRLGISRASVIRAVEAA